MLRQLWPQYHSSSYGSFFSVYGAVATVTALKAGARTALVCFEVSSAAKSAIGAPPAGFEVTSCATASSSSAAATAAASGIGVEGSLGSGIKRHRVDGSAANEGAEPSLQPSQRHHQQAARPTVPAAVAADFSSKESDTLARLLQAAAARKLQQQQQQQQPPSG